MQEVTCVTSNWRQCLVLYNSEGGGGVVAEAGNGVLPWRSKTCAILGKIGIVGVRDSGMVEMLAVGRDVLEIQDD